MLRDNNRIEEELLKERPDDLIVKYQEIVRIIVKKYITSKMFRAGDFDDIVQMVNEDILKKIATIQRQYNGTALLKTYFSAIVRNSCLKIYQKQRLEVKTLALEEEDPIEEETVSNKLEIEHDVERLQRVFRYYHRKMGRVVLCLKLYFQVPIERKDILDWFAACSEEDIVNLLECFEFVQLKRTAKQVYQIITPVLNKYEGKKNTEDAVRRWTEDRIHEIIRVLNGRRGRSKYDKETLKILLEQHSSIQAQTLDTYK